MVVASGNRDKLAALDRAVGDLAPVVSASSCAVGGDDHRADEEGPTLLANAAAKAVGWSRRLLGETVFATDGGLLIPALAGWEPVRTRRFAGDAASDVDRARALLTLASGLRGAERRIGWREALAVARGGRLLRSWQSEGEPGILAEAVDDRRLDGGDRFWVPALWLCPEFDQRRLADLTTAERASRDDHWARLGRELRHFLA